MRKDTAVGRLEVIGYWQGELRVQNLGVLAAYLFEWPCVHSSPLAPCGGKAADKRS